MLLDGETKDDAHYREEPANRLVEEFKLPHRDTIWLYLMQREARGIPSENSWMNEPGWALWRERTLPGV